MNPPEKTVFFVDVDDTLFDNDHFEHQLRLFLDERFGRHGRDTYIRIFEDLRAGEGFADFLGAAQRFRIVMDEHPSTMDLSFFLRDFPFALGLYPHALNVLSRLSDQGTPIILSDGDAFFQPHKIDRCGIRAAVADRVRIFVHKETRLDRLEQEFPASHYVLIDDKSRILSAVKREWKNRVTTIWVRQGHYARDPAASATDPPPDRTIERIGDLMDLTHLPTGTWG